MRAIPQLVAVLAAAAGCSPATWECPHPTGVFTCDVTWRCGTDAHTDTYEFKCSCADQSPPCSKDVSGAICTCIENGTATRQVPLTPDCSGVDTMEFGNDANASCGWHVPHDE